MLNSQRSLPRTNNRSRVIRIDQQSLNDIRAKSSGSEQRKIWSEILFSKGSGYPSYRKVILSGRDCCSSKPSIAVSAIL